MPREPEVIGVAKLISQFQRPHDMFPYVAPEYSNNS